LNKILNVNDEDIIYTLYSEINDYKKCIVGRHMDMIRPMLYRELKEIVKNVPQ